MERFEHKIRFTADSDRSFLKHVIENIIVNKSVSRGDEDSVGYRIGKYNNAQSDSDYKIETNRVGQVDFRILISPNYNKGEKIMFCGIGENGNTEENPNGWYIWQKENFGMPYNALDEGAYIKYINDKCVEITFYTAADIKGEVSWGDIINWMPTKWYDALARVCRQQCVHFEGCIRSTNYERGEEAIIYNERSAFMGKVITIGDEAVFYDEFEVNWD